MRGKASAAEEHKGQKALYVNPQGVLQGAKQRGLN